MNNCAAASLPVDPSEESVEAMKTLINEIIDFFGGRDAALLVLGYQSRQTFHTWTKRGIPADAAWKIQGLSDGKYKAEELSTEAANQLEIRKAQIHIDTLSAQMS